MLHRCIHAYLQSCFDKIRVQEGISQDRTRKSKQMSKCSINTVRHTVALLVDAWGLDWQHCAQNSDHSFLYTGRSLLVVV